MNITYFFPILAGIILVIKTLRKSDTTDMLGLQNSTLTRVVATFCIMYGHTLNAIKDTTIFDSINLGWCWVAVFFFWSGYGVVYSYNKKENYLKRFLYNRGIKILVPFLVAHILYFLVKTAFGIRFSILDIFQGLIGGLNIVEFSWYPIAALFMYVLFYVAWKLPVNDIWKIVIVFILTIILTGIEYAIVGIKADWWLISNLAFPIGLLFYYIGKSNKLIYIISGGC